MKTWQVLCAAAALLGAGCAVGGGEPGEVGPPTIDPNLPVDSRAAVVADTPPPSITGGTLLIVNDFTAVVADPDRDRVSIVDLEDRSVIAHVALNAGDQPGRLVEGADGRVHVVLRGSGELATIDLGSASVVDRVQVCSAPRGVAYESPTSQLHVACQSGELVTLDVDTNATTGAFEGVAVNHVARLGRDLRDVVLRGDEVLVTRFKSAELIHVDRASDVITAEHQLRSVSQRSVSLSGSAQELNLRDFDPTIAWRAIDLPDGKVAMVHQRSMSTGIELDDPHSTDPGEPLPPVDESPYGGGGGVFGPSCDSIVQSAVSVVDADGNVTHTPSIAGSVLPVDAAFDPSTNTLLVVNAGMHDPNAPTRNLGIEPGFFGGVSASGSVSRVALSQTTEEEMFDQSTCMNESIPVDGQPVAIAMAGDGGAVIQSREPAMLIMVAGSTTTTIALGGDSVLDTGHEVFHRDAGAGIACASCHAEGAEDGHVWTFNQFGPRRTQAINVGLQGTEPFHWSGDMPRLSNLVAEVFVQRMGGAQQTAERIDALGHWIFAQHGQTPIRAANDAAVMRGHELFNAPEVGCVSCHNGPKLTNSQTVDVGTGEPMQVPSLVGIAYRAPFIHTGCAPTLRDRFTDTACGGGDEHGRTSHLSDGQIDDLVAYLESL